ncbi:hypothetical protein BOSP111201_18520 [Bordetella sputigena]|uniref:TIGR02444 family protein n=1 Tax=Bordetella sputigena TaxID=1416810 RepID=UPI0039EEE6CA
MTAVAAGSFWAFSLAIYARPGVPDACLGLQDGHGLDVNVLLFALYAGQRGIALGIDDYAALETVVSDWRRQVVAPLRGIRRHVKTTLGGEGGGPSMEREVYEAIKRAELAAERAQQARMEQWLAARPTADPAGAGAGCAENLDAYLRFMQCRRDAAAQAHLQVLRAAAPAVTPAAAGRSTPSGRRPPAD